MTATETDPRPNPFFHPKPGVSLGAYVSVPRFNHTGRVYQVHYGCPEDDAWKNVQCYDLLAEEARTKRWVSILVHDGGSVVFPETMVEPVEPFELKNRSAIFYFGEGTR